MEKLKIGLLVDSEYVSAGVRNVREIQILAMRK